MSLINLSATQLRQAAELKTKIEALQTQLNRLLGGQASPAAKAASSSKSGGKRQLSAATRAKIAKAAKARWAKAKAAGKNRL